jgi:hypothetical protein
MLPTVDYRIETIITWGMMNAFSTGGWSQCRSAAKEEARAGSGASLAKSGAEPAADQAAPVLAVAESPVGQDTPVPPRPQ